ncbi:helix-turn-helix domain-containing protein [Pseudomonas aeruginosa]|uniref:helix-turn-helix domain-containing protein n=1 Tax=Pseudomonas aeruginosa TaxID=287 RepID=UPI00300D68F0
MQISLSRSLRTPTEKEMAAAIESLGWLMPFLSTQTEIQQMTVIDRNGDHQSLQLPASALHLLAQALGEIAVGHAVRLVPVHAELTSQEAADLLHISRPYLVKLLEEGVIPHTKTGRHRRVKLTDLSAYKERRDAANLAALEELAAQAQKLGMGYS